MAFEKFNVYQFERCPNASEASLVSGAVQDKVQMVPEAPTDLVEAYHRHKADCALLKSVHDLKRKYTTYLAMGASVQSRIKRRQP